MTRQGNTWSTATAWVTMPSNRHDWHMGCMDSCNTRLCFQKAV